MYIFQKYDQIMSISDGSLQTSMNHIVLFSNFLNEAKCWTDSKVNQLVGETSEMVHSMKKKIEIQNSCIIQPLCF
jgi:hypothetical protein